MNALACLQARPADEPERDSRGRGALSSPPLRPTFSGVGTRSTRVPDLAQQRARAGACSLRTQPSPARNSDGLGPPARSTGLGRSTLVGQIRDGVETVPTPVKTYSPAGGEGARRACVPAPRASAARLRMCVLFCLWLCALFPGRTAVLEEDFATDPLRRGWTLFGDATLFAWDAAGQVLSVTWDSSHSNSFFSWPLGTILSGADDFSFAFDLRLKDILAGSTPGKSNEFEIAVGLVNFASATNANAFRGAGQSAAYGVRNLVEFDYFPDAGFGDTFATTVISTNNRIFPAHNFPLTLSAGDTFRITIAYSAADRTVRTVAARNGAPFGMPPDNSLGDVRLAGTPDFRVDAFAVTSYSDAVQLGPPSVHGSVLAHGIVDNVRIVLPGPPLMNLRIQHVASRWQAEFEARTNWLYTLERSVDLRNWAPAGQSAMAEAPTLTLVDTNTPSTGSGQAPASGGFYRVRAERP